MLCKDKITSIFCIIDDILKEINHSEDIRRKVSDSEIITTAFIAATNFYGNHRSAIKFVKQYNLFPNMLEESRFNRRLHSLGNMLYELFHLIASLYKDFTCEMNCFLYLFVKTSVLIDVELQKGNNIEVIQQVCELIFTELKFS